MTQKTIILVAPYLYGLDQCIEKNLIHLGFNVINLCYNVNKTHYPNVWSRVRLLYEKYIHKDDEYRKQLKFLPFEQDFEDKLAQLKTNKADYALCIRANTLPKNIIQKIKAHSDYCVNYQWDGIDLFPDILEYQPFFDDFFVFDKKDEEKYGFKSITNFYFDFPLQADNAGMQENHKLYFLGGYNPLRNDDILQFLQTSKHLNIDLDFYMVCKDDRAKNTFGEGEMTYLTSNNALSFEQNLAKVKASSVVVDFVTPMHSGLSFRSFDALCFNKKLITTNAAIKKYDFYHKNNILVWENNSDELLAFLKMPYIEIAPQIKQKYSFTHWLNTVLNM
ncbi:MULTISPECIES: hypothetical protein [unclassified Lonepinella]|uniref:hypothetical protein n=1 Tax=unclassified Lonepinella TaxID=2642006 RepID=UPI0036DED7CE